ncbi:uncharacterized protein TRUGW13939_06672 [Talaromyces rugulosus]|uniref:NmrA-like domain-containing protein n=1 Tax=Talaromyces rugulosus TaxID=121627 RepID=A0A7H8R0P1_TALRU|nr:uncharacterized protein TRUGW13939_06672 [Talaromyces rugulosus]QKX59538.1 hypothetical protein TRUGW13939_06672 [Talaromyces rugulosus]
MSDLKQRSILITGCSQGGAGNALALQFASKGFRVFATARSLKTLANLQEKNIETLTLDVTDASSITALAAEISSRTGGSLHILFNNAGTLYEAPAVEADPARVRALFNTNVFGLMEVTTAFTPLLLAGVSPGFSPIIVNVASVLARVPNPFASAYNASKAAVASYSDTLRLELQPLGLKVKTLYMGEVSTPLMAAENINFGPQSIYHVVEDSVKARTTTHLTKTMGPAQFAREVVDEVLSGKNASIWKDISTSKVLDVTGNQGSSVENAFLNLQGWCIRGITRNPSSLAAQQRPSKEVEIVKADLDDIASLESAFRGASAIFAVTDIYNHFFNPANFAKAQEAGISVNEYACNLEITQAMKIAIAANLPDVSSTLTHFVFSSLSDTKPWSKGRYTWNFHFDGKARVVKRIREELPDLAAKPSTVQSEMPEVKLPWIIADRYIGVYVKVLLENSPRKNVLAYIQTATWCEFWTLWADVRNVKIDIKVVGLGDFFKILPEFFGGSSKTH